MRADLRVRPRFPGLVSLILQKKRRFTTKLQNIELVNAYSQIDSVSLSAQECRHVKIFQVLIRLQVNLIGTIYNRVSNHCGSIKL